MLSNRYCTEITWCGNGIFGFNATTSFGIYIWYSRGCQNSFWLVAFNPYCSISVSEMVLHCKKSMGLEKSPTWMLYIYSAQLKTCCRLGGWNHQSGHRAMILGDNCTQRFAIVFLTPGQLAGQMHSLRIHYFGSTCTWRKLVCNTKYGPKNGVNFQTYFFVPFPIVGWFWGPLFGLRNGPRNSAFFPPFAPSFGVQFGQHGRSCSDSLCAKPASPPKGLLAESFLAQS